MKETRSAGRSESEIGARQLRVICKTAIQLRGEIQAVVTNIKRDDSSDKTI